MGNRPASPARAARHTRAESREAQMRKQISTAAARIMAEEGVRDFYSAKRKAAERLNLAQIKHMPSNQEVEEALRAHLALFHADLPQTLQHLRAMAVEAMEFLADFDPRLVGPVLTGAVTKYSEIQLHLTANTPEDVTWFLMDHHIPFEELDKRLRFGGDRYINLPAFRFIANDTPVEAIVFTPEAAREAPLSPVDGKPMHRAGPREVRELLAGNDP